MNEEGLDYGDLKIYHSRLTRTFHRWRDYMGNTIMKEYLLSAIKRCCWSSFMFIQAKTRHFVSRSNRIIIIARIKKYFSPVVEDFLKILKIHKSNIPNKSEVSLIGLPRTEIHIIHRLLLCMSE